MAAVAFVNGRILIHKYLPASSGFMAGNDFDMFGQGCLGIGNHGRRKKCMGMVTAGTDYPADTERKRSTRSFEGMGAVPMNGQTAGAATGTGERWNCKFAIRL